MTAAVPSNHSVPQEAPEAFAEAVLEAGALARG